MAIQRKPKTGHKAAEDAFIQGAPDSANMSSQAGLYEKGIAKGNKRQITLTIAPDLLRKVDDAAKRTGQARAAIINMAIFHALEGNIFQS